ncbi:unnamed protein product [Chrysoparadoxa australica]
MRDWQANLHGLCVSFSDKNHRRYTGTLFPDVIKRAGWDKDESLRQLFKRSGYFQDPKKDSEIIKTIHVCRFQTTRLCMSFRKYLRMKAALGFDITDEALKLRKHTKKETPSGGKGPGNQQCRTNGHPRNVRSERMKVL